MNALPSGPHSASHDATTGSLPNAEQIAALALAALDDDKAEDILSIDVRGKSSVADIMIVASGRSQRHVGAVADHLVRKLKEAGAGEIRVEGLPQCDWVLVDAGDVLIHVFRPEVRTFYNIERLWMPDSIAARS